MTVQACADWSTCRRLVNLTIEAQRKLCRMQVRRAQWHTTVAMSLLLLVQNLLAAHPTMRALLIIAHLLTPQLKAAKSAAAHSGGHGSNTVVLACWLDSVSR